MMKRGFLTLGLGLMTSALVGLAHAVEEGDPAPDFSLRQSTRTNRPLRWLTCG